MFTYLLRDYITPLAPSGQGLLEDHCFTPSTVKIKAAAKNAVIAAVDAAELSSKDLEALLRVTLQHIIHYLRMSLPLYTVIQGTNRYKLAIYLGKVSYHLTAVRLMKTNQGSCSSVKPESVSTLSPACLKISAAR